MTGRSALLVAWFVSLLGLVAAFGPAASASSPAPSMADDGQVAYAYDSPTAATTSPANSRTDAQRGEHGSAGGSRSSTSRSGTFLAAKGGGRLPWAGHRPYAPNRELPRHPGGRPKPESDYPHTQLGTRKGRYPQSRDFDGNGRPVRDIDWTDHGKPDWHTDPHQHVYGPDGSRGGPGSVWP